MEAKLPKSFKNLINKKVFNNSDKVYDYNEPKTEEIISPNTLKFVRKAGQQFDGDEGKEYYIDEEYEEKYIALRWGIFNDCVRVYRLGEKIGIFSGYMHQNLPSLFSEKNLETNEYMIQIDDLKNRIQFAANVLDNKEEYIKQMENKLMSKDMFIEQVKEEKRQQNYNQWNDGKYISNVQIYEGE
jgi:hypothetical protein